MTSSLGHKPEGAWAFDENVTACFDDMLRRSIPQHDDMRATVSELAARFVRDETRVVDLGCSRGEALADLRERYGKGRPVAWVGVEVSKPMVLAARERFEKDRESGVWILEHDLRHGVPPGMPCSVILSVLTLQFTPIEYRQKIVASAYETLTHGGAFLLVEKVLGSTALVDETLVNTYYDRKRANGYSNEEIERKRHSLEGVLVPVTARWNEELLRSAGFEHVECVWRSLNFAGWLAVRR